MDDAQFQRIAKALADERRREILSIIAHQGETSCGAVVEKMPLTQATVSHHLKELTKAGLLSVRLERQYSLYLARPEIVEAYAAELRRRLGLTDPDKSPEK